MKCIYRIFVLCMIVSWCGICFAGDSFVVNTAAYDVYGPASVAVDINNTPVVVSENSLIDLVLINQVSNGYEVNSIPQTSGSEVPHLLVTSNNELALCFIKGGELWYGSKGSWFDWSFFQVAGPSVNTCDMALTASDIPHIAYIRQNEAYHVFYDVRSQQWITEHLYGFGSILKYKIDIDISGDGKIMIVCSNDYEIAAAICEGGFWRYLSSIGVYFMNLSIDCSFTSDNLPAVAYLAGSELIYAVYVSDIIGWVKTVVTGYIGTYPSNSVSLSHSSAGVPGIGYVDGYKLMYATNVTAVWTTVIVDEHGIYPDLLFDGNDKPLFVYSSYDYCVDKLVTKLAGIGLEGFNITDLNNDKFVNFEDFAVMAESWMHMLLQPDISVGDFTLDGAVDFGDLKWLCCSWLWQGR